MTASFKVCENWNDVTKCIAVRAIVFCGEQGIAYRLEQDEHDAGAVHVLGEIDGEPVAAARLRCFADYAKLERIAVRQPWRGRGLGHGLTEFMLGIARERGYVAFKLGAQVHLRAFYESHGFQVTGEQFLDADIWHWPMEKRAQS
jgi:predicted GNAT family N-acyltransferase